MSKNKEQIQDSTGGLLNVEKRLNDKTVIVQNGLGKYVRMFKDSNNKYTFSSGYTQEYNSVNEAILRENL